jgi:hypothetical protein
MLVQKAVMLGFALLGRVQPKLQNLIVIGKIQLGLVSRPKSIWWAA